MKRMLAAFILLSAFPLAHSQQLPQPSQAQMAACLAALPPAPIQPQPPSPSPFPFLDDMMRRKGINPDALRQIQYQAAQRKYQLDVQAYQQKQVACFAPPAPAIVAPASPITPSPATPQAPKQ